MCRLLAERTGHSSATATTEQRKRGFAALWEQMQAVRKAGYAISEAELDADKAGVAAPVFRPGRGAAGRLCLVIDDYALPKGDLSLTTRPGTDAKVSG